MSVNQGLYIQKSCLLSDKCIETKSELSAVLVSLPEKLTQEQLHLVKNDGPGRVAWLARASSPTHKVEGSVPGQAHT